MNFMMTAVEQLPATLKHFNKIIRIFERGFKYIKNTDIVAFMWVIFFIKLCAVEAGLIVMALS